MWVGRRRTCTVKIGEKLFAIFLLFIAERGSAILTLRLQYETMNICFIVACSKQNIFIGPIVTIVWENCLV